MRNPSWLVGLAPFALAVLLTGPLSAASTELTRDWGNLEGTWLFRTDPDDVGEKQGWQRSDFREEGWRTLQVPGSWEPQGVTDPRPGRPPKPAEGALYSDYDGVAWYRLHFIVPQAWAGQKLLLSLGSVDDEDRTFLNGELVGATGPGVERAVTVQRLYPVAPERVKWGEENVLAVRVLDGGGPGGMNGPLVSLLPETFAEGPLQIPQDNRPLPERFVDPPASSRMLKIIHSWPDAPQAQDILLRQLVSQGFGGVVCNVSFAHYLENDAEWQAFVRAVKQAKSAGMSLWLYDERGYPSGTAGGITLRGHPEWQAAGLLIAEATTSGGQVALDVPPGQLVRASAFPVTGGGVDPAKAVDLAGHIAGKRLVWQAPTGSWRVMVITEGPLYEGTHSSLSLGDHIPYINLLMPEPTARFLEVTHDQYAAHLGQNLGQWFVSTFTDEPSLMSFFMRSMPYSVLPWAPNLPEEFRKRRGYALEPVLPLLVADAGGAERKARYDFWQTVGELVSESFFGQIEANCRRHGFRSGGHLLAEESFLGDVSLYGSFFACARRLDAPSIDCLTSTPAAVPWFSARLLSSIADLQGSPVTMCETSDFGEIYRPPGDKRPVVQVTEDEIRGTCNRLLWAGISTITSYYTFSGLSGAQLRRLNDWVGRCSTMLTGGHRVTDVALLYPVESAWPRVTPSRSGATDSAEAATVEQAFNGARDSLYTARRDFTFVDARALAESKPDRGALAHGDLRWRVVILPAADTLPLAAWERLAEFERSGGVVVALGALPRNSESEFPCPRVQALAKELFGGPGEAHILANAAGGAGVYLPPGSEALLPNVLDALLEPDARAVDPRAAIHATHLEIDGHEVYFLINDDKSPWQGEVGLSASGKGDLWDPATGKMTARDSNGPVKLSLGPYGAAFLRFAAARAPRRLPARSGPLPGLTVTPLPVVQPTTGKGEFVTAEVASDPQHVRAGVPAWRAVGTLTKGKTDTFLFLGFEYPKGLDLSGAECLEIESWVPDGQTTPARLIVILREKDGGQYLTGTGRPLGSAGYFQSFVPLSRFEPAGWAKDPDGRLNLAEIVGISIGWGGYYGTEGEKVEFSLAAPQSAGLAPARP